MNEKQLKYLQDFKERLLELDIIEGEDYIIRTAKNDYITIEVTHNENKELESRRNIHCIMGMIYHFSNRKWIIDYSYTYIMKSYQAILFNDGKTETN